MISPGELTAKINQPHIHHSRGSRGRLLINLFCTLPEIILGDFGHLSSLQFSKLTKILEIDGYCYLLLLLRHQLLFHSSIQMVLMPALFLALQQREYSVFLILFIL